MPSETTLTDLIEWNGELESLIESSRASAQDDGDEPLVHLTRHHLAQVLNRFLLGEITCGDLEAWAEAVEDRDDIGYEEAHETLIAELLFELSSPDIDLPVSADLARSWLPRLSA